MPTPLNYNCSKCDFKGSSMSTWGGFYYKKDKILVTIHRVIGICYTCDDIVPVEKLPDNKYLDRLAESSKRNAASDILIEDEKGRSKLLKNRESNSRCLECGSHDFDIVPNTEQPKERMRSNTPWRAGLIHKNCGGQIYVRRSPANFFMGDRLPKRYYNVEGVEIKNAL